MYQKCNENTLPLTVLGFNFHLELEPKFYNIYLCVTYDFYYTYLLKVLMVSVLLTFLQLMKDLL